MRLPRPFGLAFLSLAFLVAPIEHFASIEWARESRTVGPGGLGPMVLGFGVPVGLFAVVQMIEAGIALAIACGIWRMRGWGWLLAFGKLSFNVVDAVAGCVSVFCRLSAGGLGNLTDEEVVGVKMGTLLGLLWAAGNGAIVAYLFRARALFRRGL